MLVTASLPALPATAEVTSQPLVPKDASKPADPLHRDSPQSCVYSFLEAARAGDYTRACTYLDLRRLPQSARLNTGRSLAQELEQILNRDTNFDVADLSREPQGSQASGVPADRERVDSFNANGQKLDIELERTRLRSGIWIWRFSPETVARIPQLWRITSQSPVEKYLPDPLVNWKLLDTALWRWATLILLAVMLAALSRSICRCALLLAGPFVKRFAPRVNPNVMEGFVGPSRLLISLALLRIGMEWIDPSPRLRLFLNRGLALLFFAGLFWLLARVVDLIMRRLRVLLHGRQHAFSYSALPLASRILKITILVLMITAVLSEWGYNTTTIVAGLGVGGIAVALAAQKTIENVFGGVAVITDRPVAVGDYCKFGDRSGTVEDIGLRSTRLRTPERTLVSVPNGQFSAMTIENLSERDKRLFHFLLNLRRDTKPDQVRTVLESITRTLEEHPKIESGKFPIHFAGVGTYSLDLEASVYVLTSEDDEFAQIQQELLLRVLDAVEAAGTALALPTQASVDYSRAAEPHPNGAAPSLSEKEVRDGNRAG